MSSMQIVFTAFVAITWLSTSQAGIVTPPIELKENAAPFILSNASSHQLKIQKSSKCIPSDPGGVVFKSKATECPCYLNYLVGGFSARPDTVMNFLLMKEEDYQTYADSDFSSTPVYNEKFSETRKSMDSFSRRESIYFYQSEQALFEESGTWRVVAQGTGGESEDCASTVGVVFDKAMEECPAQIEEKIVGGNDDTEESIQNNIVFYSNGRGNCTGSLISPTTVLTVAHCTVGRVTEVRVGGDSGSTGEVYEVSEGISHPSFEESGGQTGEYEDIALIKLARSVEGVKPFRVNGNSAYDSGVGRAVGYGLIADRFLAGVGELRQVDLPVVPLEDCIDIYRRVNPPLSLILSTSRMCAGGACGGVCNGDSGGPLLSLDKETGEYIQTGIVSLGTRCGAPGQPQIFTRVSSFAKWIQSNTAGEDVNTLEAVPINPEVSASGSINPSDGGSGAFGPPRGRDPEGSVERAGGVVLPVWGIVLIGVGSAILATILIGTALYWHRGRNSKRGDNATDIESPDSEGQYRNVLSPNEPELDTR